MEQAVLLDITGGVATITLNRPDARNRLDAEGMDLLASLLQQTAADDRVRVVVLTGSGTTFCSGADLSAAETASGFSGSGPAALVRVLEAILDHPRPVIARVQGHVAGGGNGLVAACDIAVAVESARFAFSEVRVGVAPAVISVACLAVMERRAAQELFLTGERIDADRARRAGLITACVADDALDSVIDGYVEQLLAGGPQALTQAKAILRRVPALDRQSAFAEMAELSASMFSSDEAREGMTAFLEKRPPSWAGGR